MTIQFATGKVSIGTTATEIVPVRAGRTELRLFSIPGVGGSGLPVFYGPDSSLTTSNGYPVNSLSATSPVEKTLNVESAVYGIATVPLAVYFLEIFSA